MRYIVRSECRPARVICAVSWPMRIIAPNEPCWHERTRNWYACLDKGEKLDAWIAVIEDALKNKETIRDAAIRSGGPWKIAPEPALAERKIIPIKTKELPIQGKLF